MRCSIAAFFVLLVQLVSVSARADAYFVSAAGDDGAAGTSEATAWRTLARVQSAMSVLGPGDTVSFRRGDVFEGTLVETASGAAGSPLTFDAYGTGDRPVLRGSIALGAWRPGPASGTFEADVPGRPAALASALAVEAGAYRLLTLGRFPRLSAPDGGYLSFESHSGTGSFTDTTLTSTPSFVGGEVVYRLKRWILERAPIVGHTGGTLTFSAPGSESLDDRSGYFIQNHLATLTEDGDWMYDRARGVFVVRWTGTPPAIRVDTVEHLIAGNGIANVVIAGVAFEQGFGAQVFLENATDVEIRDCAFSFAGTHAVFARETGGLTLTANEVTNAVSSGFDVYSPRDRAVTVRDNVLTDTGTVAGMGAGRDRGYMGIRVSVQSDAVIENNRIVNTGFIPIAFYGNGVTIRHNVIERYCFVKDDGGAIYTWNGGVPVRPWVDRVITGNIISLGLGEPDGSVSGSGDVEGIYLDNNTMEVRVTGNTVYRVNGSGFYANSPQNVEVTGNTFYDDARGVGLTRYVNDGSSPVNGGQDLMNVVIRDNILFPRDAAQRLIAYSDLGLLFSEPPSTGWTVDARLRMIGSIDANISSPIPTLAFAVAYRDMAGAPYQTLRPWSLETWRRRSGYDGASTLVELPASFDPSSVGDTNLAMNGTFDADTSGVGFYPPSSRVVWDGSGALTGAGALAVSVATPSEEDEVLVYSRIGAVSVGTYRIRFSSRTSVGEGSILVGIRRSGSPYEIISSQALVAFGTERAEHEVYVDVNEAVDAASWQLDVADSATPIFIDDVDVRTAVGTRVGPDDYLRFEVNPSASPLVVPLLDADYRDVRGGAHVGDATLPPFGSLLLVRTGPPTLRPDAGGVDASGVDASTSSDASGRDGGLEGLDAGGPGPATGCGCRGAGSRAVVGARAATCVFFFLILGLPRHARRTRGRGRQFTAGGRVG